MAKVQIMETSTTVCVSTVGLSGRVFVESCGIVEFNVTVPASTNDLGDVFASIAEEVTRAWGEEPSSLHAGMLSRTSQPKADVSMTAEGE